MSVLRRGLFAVVGLSSMGLLVAMAAGPVTAAPTESPTTSENAASRCVPGQPFAARSDRFDRPADPSAAQVRAWEAQFRDAYRGLDATERRRAKRGRIRVPVRVHAVAPKKGKWKTPRKRIRQQIRILNRSYRGRTHAKSVRSKFRFRLKSIDRTVNKRWYYAGQGTRAANTMIRKLRQGDRYTLNLYLTEPRGHGGPQLGFARFPWSYKNYPRIDGVVIHVASMKNGRFGRYSRGDTAVHEVGHWLGLYHTFQGGCGKKGDRVGDTPKEKSPNYKCPKNRNTCPAKGSDPVHNFMDYSTDKCLNRFTRGQVKRMHKRWAAFRSR